LVGSAGIPAKNWM